MKKGVITYLFISLSSLLFSQAKIIMNDSIFLVIENAGFVVIDNDSTNALTTTGNGGGNIFSEHENDVIKWNIDTTQGIYNIPYTTNSGVKIPFIMDVKSPTATGNGYFLFSTYETSSDFNTSYPSVVTHMNSYAIGGSDASLFTVDRFWRVEALNYTTKPTVTMEFYYDDNVNEIGDNNTITESNLKAQRFNTDVNDWEGLLFGKTNSTVNRTYAVNVDPTDFYAFWTLVDQTTPLPIALIDFNLICNSENVILRWATASEFNNDYFIVEKSYDGLHFYDLTKVQGAGNSNSNINYQTTDIVGNRIAYYRLKQVDYNADFTYSDILSTNCNSSNFIVNQFVFNDNGLSFNIETSFDELSSITLYDIKGREIATKSVSLQKGINKVELNNNHLENSIYLLSINGSKNNFTTKLLKH